MPQYGTIDPDNVSCTSQFDGAPCQVKGCPVHDPEPQGTLEKFPFLLVTIEPGSHFTISQRFVDKFQFYSLLIDEESADHLDIGDISIETRSLLITSRVLPACMFLAGC